MRRRDRYADQAANNVQYCEGKRAYSKKGATTAANARFKRDHVRLRVYHCRDCNRWHLTKQLRGDANLSFIPCEHKKRKKHKKWY